MAFWLHNVCRGSEKEGEVIGGALASVFDHWMSAVDESVPGILSEMKVFSAKLTGIFLA